MNSTHTKGKKKSMSKLLTDWCSAQARKTNNNRNITYICEEMYLKAWLSAV